MENNNLEPLSIDDFARLISVSPRTVRRLIDSGDLLPTRIGATWALSLKALAEPLRSALHQGSAVPLLRLYEVAERLNCSPDDVRKLARDGFLQPVQIGGSQRWTQAAVETYRTEGHRHDPR
jgi:predicted DNA-binding transcriptional regulator AlpA